MPSPTMSHREKPQQPQLGRQTFRSKQADKSRQLGNFLEGKQGNMYDMEKTE